MDNDIDQQTLVEYPFPANCDDSVFYAFSGARVEKAVLEAKGIVLGVIFPKYSEDLGPNDEIPVTDLNFFGDKPFHAALATDWSPKITLYVSDRRYPSLVLKPINNSVRWTDLNDLVYTERVMTNSTSGCKERTMVYTPSIGGFKRE